MRQIGQALLLYANENEGRYPAALEPLLLTQDITPDVFCCPSSYDTPAPGASVEERSNALLQGVHLSYIYLGHEKGAQAPADAVILYEPLANHDGDGMNILFGDGHVEFVDAQTAQKLIRDATSNTSATTQASER